MPDKPGDVIRELATRWATLDEWCSCDSCILIRRALKLADAVDKMQEAADTFVNRAEHKQATVETAIL